MKLIQSLIVGLTTLCLGCAVIAATTEIAGVKVEDSATVGGSKIQLPGDLSNRRITGVVGEFSGGVEIIDGEVY